MVSQSGGIGVMAHARAQDMGLGFRVTISCGNEASLGIPDFIRALAQDDGTRLIAVYTEALSNPAAFIEALAATSEAAVAAAEQVGFPVALKGISAAITHRAAAGLVALNLDTAEAVAKTEQTFRARAAERGVALDGIWVQHMFGGDHELLVTAFRDAEFGVMVGCGIGGGMTEIVDDVVFARAPVDEQGAVNLVASLRTIRRLPDLLAERERQRAAAFIARFSALAATAPWPRFTFEVNPVKLGEDAIAAVDGLLVIG